MSSQFTQQGMHYVRLAQQQHASGVYIEALSNYELGIESLLKALKYEKLPKPRQLLEEKIKELLTEAEQLKKDLKSGNVRHGGTPASSSSSANSGGVPPGALDLPSVPANDPLELPSVPTNLPAASKPGGPAGALVKSIVIKYGDQGHSYTSLFGPYLSGDIELCDPYLLAHHQLMNLVNFVALCVQSGCSSVTVLTSRGKTAEQQKMQNEAFNHISASSKDFGMIFKVSFLPHLHDRHITSSQGFRIVLGRGLDIFKGPEGPIPKYSIAKVLKSCLATRIDVFTDHARK